MTKPLLIECNRVSKVYGRRERSRVSALRDVSLGIGAGEYVAVIGRSGSGKSTLLHILGALQVPSAGEYHFMGRAVSRMRERELARFRNEVVGFVFQSFNLLPKKSVLANVMLPLIYARRGKARKERAKEVLRQVGLEDTLWRRRPNELSGGERQRVAIARALVNSPPLLLADEPTGNLDTKTGNDIISLFESLNRAGSALVIITHDESIAKRADRVIEMEDGKIVS